MASSRALTRLTSVVTGVLALVVLTGCGGSDDKDASAGSPVSTSSEPQDNGDETDSASGGLIDICSKVTAAEISELLGGPVTSEEVPGGGCSFSNEENPRAASVQLNSSLLDEGAGGFDGSVAGISAVLQGSPGAALDGVGDQAFIKVGTFASSELVRGSGLVRVGSTVFQVDLSPNQGTSAKDVQAIMVDALNLIATKA